MLPEHRGRETDEGFGVGEPGYLGIVACVFKHRGTRKAATVSGLSARILKILMNRASATTGDRAPWWSLVMKSVSIMPGDRRPAVTGEPSSSLANPLVK